MNLEKLKVRRRWYYVASIVNLAFCILVTTIPPVGYLSSLYFLILSIVFYCFGSFVEFLIEMEKEESDD